MVDTVPSLRTPTRMPAATMAEPPMERRASSTAVSVTTTLPCSGSPVGTCRPTTTKPSACSFFSTTAICAARSAGGSFFPNK